MAAIKGIEGMDGKEFAYELQRGGNLLFTSFALPIRSLISQPYNYPLEH